MSKTRAYRIENIPSNTTRETLLALFDESDRAALEVRSLSPSSDGSGDLVATIAFTTSDDALPKLLDEDLSLDTDFFGLTPLNVPEEPIADVVAVPGIGQHAFDSWATSPKRMWLRDSLPTDVPRLRIFTYGYKSDVTGTTDLLTHLAQAFLQRLRTIYGSNQDSRRPLVLIGHSLGCLIIKKALDLVLTRAVPDLSPNVQCLIFFGAPHRGISGDTLSTMFGSRPPENMVQELGFQSQSLRDLDAAFVFWANMTYVIACHEQPSSTRSSESDHPPADDQTPAVAQNMPNSSGWVARSTVLSDADHINMAKLRRTQAGPYHTVIHDLKQALAGAGSVQSTPLWSGQAIVSPMGPRPSSITEQQRLELPSGDLLRTPRTSVSFQPSPAVAVPLNGSQGRESWVLPEPAVELTADRRLDPAELEGNNVPLTLSPTAPRPSSGGSAVTSSSLSPGSEGPITQQRPIESPPMPPLARSPTSGSFLKNSSRRGTFESMFSKFGRKGSIEGPGDVYAGLLFNAARNGDLQEAEMLLKQKVNVNVKSADDENNTALHYAARAGHLDMVKLLVKGGAKIDAKSKERNWIPLHEAAANGHADIIDWMIDQDSHLRSAKADDDSTPLHYAAAGGHLKAVRLLVKSGATVLAKRADHVTPLELSIKRGHSDVSKYLQKAGETPDTVRWAMIPG